MAQQKRTAELSAGLGITGAGGSGSGLSVAGAGSFEGPSPTAVWLRHKLLQGDAGEEQLGVAQGTAASVEAQLDEEVRARLAVPLCPEAGAPQQAMREWLRSVEAAADLATWLHARG